MLAVGFRPPTRPKDLELDRPGAMARHLSDHTHGSPLEPVWDEWAERAQEPVTRHAAMVEAADA
ncbi:hypothetical protein K0817_002345 [Microbacterium sp. HD4P20]|uniref:hypothetical protein n=1 Tax=Microbacterium sp. HD4P20 TaxID=2864874 RepID=UPI0020A59B36|nr:hypothetical protein [Microbacterium sp. HD4P20]MCP2635402.1 hypothetical protein [Microbacterium sp. HD4P20]